MFPIWFGILMPLIAVIDTIGVTASFIDRHLRKVL